MNPRLTVDAAAALWGMSPQMVRRYCKAKRVKCEYRNREGQRTKLKGGVWTILQTEPPVRELRPRNQKRGDAE